MGEQKDKREGAKDQATERRDVEKTEANKRK